MNSYNHFSNLTAGSHPGSEKVPLCVPRWDETRALNAGALWNKRDGFHAEDPEYLDPVWEWLPLRWKCEGQQVALWPEMLPATTWEENLRSALPEDRWDALRKHAYSAAGYRCEICGGAPRPHLEAHEKWEFDDVWCVQRLAGILALCPPCHKAHHLGLARRLGLYEDVLAKMEEVNGWSRAQTLSALEKARAQADERNRYHWTVDLSWLETGPYHMVYRLGGSR